MIPDPEDNIGTSRGSGWGYNMETSIVYWNYVGIMEKKTKATIRCPPEKNRLYS